MHFVWRMRSAKFQSSIRPRFSNSRTQLALSGKVFFCQANDDTAESEMSGSFSLKVDKSFPNPPNDKEKPVAPLPASLSPSMLDSKKLKAISRVSEICPDGKLRPQVLYLMELGMNLDQIKSMARRFPASAYYSLEGKIKPLVEFLVDLGVPKSDIPTIFNKCPRLCGFSLSENIIPTMAFLEGLGVDKNQWPKLIYGFPNFLGYSRQKVNTTVDFLYEMGLSAESVGKILTRYPPTIGFSVERKIKPVVQFLLDLGVPKSDIPTIFNRRPQLFGISLSEKFIPSMAFFEDLGVDKKQWAKLICGFPSILSYGRQKVKSNVNFLYEMGLSAESVGKILTRFPPIIGCSVEDKLRTTAMYFRSLGVDVALLLCRAPHIFGLSVEGNLKPVTEFFLERGYSMEEVGTMISRFGNLYSYSLSRNLMPKWEFFLTMDYPQSELVKHPQYFGYSLEKRIKPRYALIKECGVVLPISSLLMPSSDDFQKALESKLKKKTC